MFEQSVATEPRNVIGDWALRGFIALIFVFAGWDKFDSGSMWPAYFNHLGLGQWFRYFTGIVEIFAGVLVLIPPIATAGIALLAVTMAGATVANAIVHPPNCFLSGIFTVALTGIWWNRRSR